MRRPGLRDRGRERRGAVARDGRLRAVRRRPERRGGGGFGGEPILPNTPYDGKFTFVRMRYGPPVAYASQRVMWSHDYPTGEQHFMKILNELTYLGAAHRGNQHPVVRRSRSVQVSDRLHL